MMRSMSSLNVILISSPSLTTISAQSINRMTMFTLVATLRIKWSTYTLFGTNILTSSTILSWISSYAISCNEVA